MEALLWEVQEGLPPARAGLGHGRALCLQEARAEGPRAGADVLQSSLLAGPAQVWT